MMRIDPPEYRYCPFCGSHLESRIEEDRNRSYCRACLWTYYPYVAGSVTALISRGCQVLLVKRKREPFLGTWMMPSGFIEYGEHPEDTVRREVREETGLTARSLDLIGVFQSEDDPRQLGHFVFVYQVGVSDGEIITDIEENDEIAWFDVAELPNVSWKIHRRMLVELVKKNT
jgi:ADP-ribose pyrophosphatase YjhB (NUDIX family)